MADGVGEVDGDPGGAVTEPLADQARPALGAALLRGQLLGLVLLTDLGGDDVQDPPAQDPQLPRTELGGLRDQMGLRVPQHLGRDLVGGQLVEGVGDHLRLRHVQLAGTKTRGHTGPAAVQRLSQRQVAPVRAVVATGVVGHQRRHVPGTLGQGHVVGDRHQPQLQRGQLRLQPGQPQQRGPLVGRVHEHDLHIGRVLERSLDRVGTREHRMNGSRSNVELTSHLLQPTTDQWGWFSRVDAARL